MITFKSPDISFNHFENRLSPDNISFPQIIFNLISTYLNVITICEDVSSNYYYVPATNLNHISRGEDDILPYSNDMSTYYLLITGCVKDISRYLNEKAFYHIGGPRF